MEQRLIDANALMFEFRRYMVEHYDREKCISEENCKTCESGCLWRRIVRNAPTVKLEDFIRYNLDLVSRTFHYEVVEREDADLVKIVRCKDCKHYEPCEGGKDYCCWHESGVVENDFCSYGERRDSDG